MALCKHLCKHFSKLPKALLALAWAVPVRGAMVWTLLSKHEKNENNEVQWATRTALKQLWKKLLGRVFPSEKLLTAHDCAFAQHEQYAWKLLRAFLRYACSFSDTEVPRNGKNRSKRFSRLLMGNLATALVCSAQPLGWRVFSLDFFSEKAINKNCVARYTIFANAKMNEAGDTPAPRSSGWHSPATKQPDNRYAFAGANREGGAWSAFRSWVQTAFHKRWMPRHPFSRKLQPWQRTRYRTVTPCGLVQAIILLKFCFE